MNNYLHIGVPENFNDLLPELKAKTLKWETVCYSGTKINNNAKISFYSAITNTAGYFVRRRNKNRQILFGTRFTSSSKRIKS